MPDPTAKGLRFPQDAVYLRGMMFPRDEDQRTRGPMRPGELLEFHPWMLALAVFLACALGIAVMEQVRDAGAMWAQVTAQDTPAPGR